MSLPLAYCVKCREYTDASSKHTVMLANNSRALKGCCPKCDSEVYLIMPKKELKEKSQTIYALDKVFSHDAYCVKCRKQSKVNYAHGVIFKNGRKAVRGQCESCGCDAYKILHEKIIIRDVSASRRLSDASSSTQIARATRRTSDKSKMMTAVFFVAFAVVIGASLAIILN